MSKKDQYPVSRYTGLPVEDDGNGGYQLHYDANGQIRLHTWRTGKHTKGRFRRIGQLMLTENGLMVMIVKSEPMAFKDRHSEVPLGRFLSANVDSATLAKGLVILDQQS